MPTLHREILMIKKSQEFPVFVGLIIILKTSTNFTAIMENIPPEESFLLM